MLFQSQIFVLVFLPALLAGFYLTARVVWQREMLLIAGSLVFYGWWDIRFLPLLVGQTVISWLLAEAYIRRPYRFLPAIVVIANLAVLGVFKYANFFIDTVTSVTGYEIAEASIILPIGISFYTFQILSYAIDLRRGAAPHYPLRRFCLFIFFFPQLIAGPIVRHNEIMHQFDFDPWREGLAERFGRGMTLFTIGFAKKVLIADKLAVIADPIYLSSTTGIPDLGAAWTGALAFTFQLFFDFSAYSEMAIGLGMMIGLRLPPNFEVPYRAVDLRDFWRRWHMTLSRFLRDYLYIPLGGSRHGWRLYVFATMITMGLVGLWHGAGWTFVVWGLFHGAGLVANRSWHKAGYSMPPVAGWLVTMLFVIIGWVLFRSSDFQSAAYMLMGMVGLGEGLGEFKSAGLIAIAAVVSVVGPSSLRFVDEYLPDRRIVAMAVAALFVVVVLQVGKGQAISFIYFQF